MYPQCLIVSQLLAILIWGFVHKIRTRYQRYVVMQSITNHNMLWFHGWLKKWWLVCCVQRLERTKKKSPLSGAFSKNSRTWVRYSSGVKTLYRTSFGGTRETLCILPKGGCRYGPNITTPSQDCRLPKTINSKDKGAHYGSVLRKQECPKQRWPRSPQMGMQLHACGAQQTVPWRFPNLPGSCSRGEKDLSPIEWLLLL